MTLAFDVYFSFRSPYSYLAAQQVEAITRAWDVEPVMRIVRPIAIRIPGFFERADPLRTPYMRMDAIRCAEVQGLPYRWPKPDPVVIDDSTGKVASDQPYIHHITRLGAAAAEAGCGLPFAARVSAMMWSGAIDDWHQGDHVATAATQAGADYAALSAAVDADPARFDAMLDANETAQRAAGHWGVPLFVFEDEPFFGQDRVDHLLFRMKQHGLRKRA